MAYATNPLDGIRTYFETSGGAGPPVLFYTGFADPLEVAKGSGLARALTADPAALEAAWRSVQIEGPVSRDLSRWRVPCLICVGEADEMHDDARRAAEKIPAARFVSLAGHSHISAFYEADDLLLPHILKLLRSATPTP